MSLSKIQELYKEVLENCSDMNDFQNALKLARKIEANSNLKACASDVFYIHDPELIKEITEEIVYIRILRFTRLSAHPIFLCTSPFS